jgi:hypothetical protein
MLLTVVVYFRGRAKRAALAIRVQEACLKSVAKAQGRASINVQFDEKIENVLTEVLAEIVRQ